MERDNRPKKDGKLYKICEKCGIKPHECKGFCIFQKIEEREGKTDGNRIQHHGRFK